MIDGSGEHIGAQDHTRPAPGWRVIDTLVLVGREVPDLDGLARPSASAPAHAPASDTPSGPGNISG